MEKPIYLDYNATTPVDPRVVAAMIPYLNEHFGNASSAHAYGYEARAAMERARERVARLIGAAQDEVIFTGGGSETDNLAIKGAVFPHLERRPHVISTVVEHPAVLNTLQYLRRRFAVDYTLLPVDEYGLLAADQVRDALRPETVLVSVMHANNEVGTLQSLQEIAEVTREAGVLLHTDGAQSVGKVPVQVRDLGVDMLTVAGHKLYAPKGIGALYLRRGITLDPLIHGSSQEHGLRAGTENVASMVALGAAAEIAWQELPDEMPRLTALRDTLFDELARQIPGTILNGHPSRRLPNTLNVSLPKVLGQTVLALAPDVAASTGSACHSGQTEPSPVLLALGLPAERALSALRLSVGRWSTRYDVVRAAELLTEGYAAALGSLSPLA